MFRNTTRLRIHFLACCFLILQQTSVFGDEAFFGNKVAPILQAKCLSCHNEEEPKGDFSLQSARAIFADGHVEPGDAASSHLFDLISVVDGEAEMPKDASPLSADEISAIQTWIDDGAKWPENFELSAPEIADLDWWSLKPLTRPQTPKVATDSENVRTPIDAFILRKLREKNLQPSSEADRLTLVRRLYFDLIGLPPSPAEVRAFLNDGDPDAYENLVDRLLASEHYGERWARHWLDVAHYADTHGYDKDKPRPNAWPYRDYVIRSLNEDKPYSRFVLEQLAGDALWPNTLDGVTATGFIAAGPWDFIGHAEVPESKIDGRIARNLDRDDMVTSTMNTFCSVTVQCARCHDHKFDPVSQEHYYSLQAVFAALDRVDTRFDTDPKIAAERTELQNQKLSLSAKRNELQRLAEQRAGEELRTLNEKIAQQEKTQKPATNQRPEFGYHSQIENNPNVSKWVQVDLGEPIRISKIVFVGCYDNFNNIGAGFGFPPRYKIESSIDPEFKSNIATLLDRTGEDNSNPGTAPQSISVDAERKVRYVRFTATKLASRSNDFIFALSELQILNAKSENVALGKKVTSLDSIEAPVRWRRANLVDNISYRSATDQQKVGTNLVQLRSIREALIDASLTSNQRETKRKTLAALKEVEVTFAAFPAQSVVYAGTIHHGSGNFVGTGSNGGKPREIHVLHRGDVLTPRELALPGTIPIIDNADSRFRLPASHDESERRIALARWIVNPKNPLTWRSIVNRVWHYHFGRGLVDTPNDFGRMGAMPTHPELLEWLAVEFRDGGGSLKKLHKLIVTSSVYRQQSAHHPQNSRIDSNNAFLWRMNRRRLSAEEIRDAVLAVSGKLDRSTFGPPFQEFVVERPEHSPHYQYDKHDVDDPKTHRRSIYRFTVRSQPDPFMATLDCADSSQSVAKRDETVTALQALSLLNNSFMLRMSEHFAATLERESSVAVEQIELAHTLTTGRHPTESEQAKLLAFQNEFGTPGLCRLLLNLNEFVFVD